MLARDFGLTETQLDFRKMAAEFVDAEIVPNARDWDRAESVDTAIVRRLGELGFLGLMVPEQYGGVDADMLSYILVTEELGRGDSAVRGIVSVSLGLVTKTIAAYGTDEQKQEWLPQLVSGESLGCFGLTEPGTGSDAGSLSTRAKQDGSDWILNGSKMFITNGTWAKVALTFARTGDTGITAFLVPTDSPGFAAKEIKGKLGLRGQATAELTFDNVRVPDSARLGEVGRGLGIALGALSRGRISVAAGSVGVAQAALDAATRYSTEREQFGKPIASFQLVQELLADAAVDVQSSRLMTHHVARMADAGIAPKDYATDASAAKYHASETAVQVTNNCLQVFGGYGFIDEYPVGKYVRDARVLTLYEGTSQVQKLIIGRDLTGIDALT
ncbi:acyl-CoA dehydrogenase family protein [Amycolatopsis acidiphila]|uniref:Acyl-CoA dehydrogenase n=1 Tax=Amycolatopsis acidiphila TaxID=715473 RepID=A0A558A6Z8_9PSEU|nr:acyl-CoA dehydrogenase family protein [Amycolatopsis acidiphila]TVT20022.1 acyl-CoA dehydrogenase [Amycolatopsis acidiphila]UIJ63484.1 acyl-CoA dehydrogenase family protein [Amycolatopsis acidiphila]GHG68658.1 acyl-CoA dehydrogenase [Amycolatopsis acidiphila]